MIDNNNESKIINKDSFSDRIIVKEDEEEKYLKELQLKYEAGEIRKNRISKMLKELKAL